MSKVSVIADSTCDLSKELVERYHIGIFPLHIHLGDREYSDGIDITPDEIYAWSDANKSTPKTSAPSLPDVQECMKKRLEDGGEVVCFCISEEMSSSATVARLAAQELECEERVFVINSANLSTGIGLQVIEAAVMADQGMPAKEIVEKILVIQPLVRASFVVDTLTYLHRGGRCSGLAAMAGGTLKLHPCISVADGEMGAGKKYRGKMEKVIHDYVEDLKPELKKAKKDRVFITHSGCEASIVESVRQSLQALGHFEEILETRAGGVVSSHCGPGTLGVLFIAGE